MRESHVLRRLNLQSHFELWQNSMNPRPEMACDTLAQFFTSDFCDHPDRIIYSVQFWASYFESIFCHQGDLDGVTRIGAEFGEPEKFLAYIIFLGNSDVTSDDLIASQLFTHFMVTSDEDDLKKLRNTLIEFLKLNDHIELNYDIELSDGIDNLNALANTTPSFVRGYPLNHPVQGGYQSMNILGGIFKHLEKFPEPASWNLSPERRFGGSTDFVLPDFLPTLTEQNIRNILSLVSVEKLLAMYSDQKGAPLLGVIIARIVGVEKFFSTLESMIEADHLSLRLTYYFLGCFHLPLEEANPHPYVYVILSHLDKSSNPRLFSEHANFIINRYSGGNSMNANQFFKVLLDRLAFGTALSDNEINFIFNQSLRVDDERLSDDALLLIDVLPGHELFFKAKIDALTQTIRNSFSPDGAFFPMYASWGSVLRIAERIKLLSPDVAENSDFPFDKYALMAQVVECAWASRETHPFNFDAVFSDMLHPQSTPIEKVDILCGIVNREVRASVITEYCAIAIPELLRSPDSLEKTEQLSLVAEALANQAAVLLDQDEIPLELMRTLLILFNLVQDSDRDMVQMMNLLNLRYLLTPALTEAVFATIRTCDTNLAAIVRMPLYPLHQLFGLLMTALDQTVAAVDQDKNAGLKNLVSRLKTQMDGATFFSELKVCLQDIAALPRPSFPSRLFGMRSDPLEVFYNALSNGLDLLGRNANNIEQMNKYFQKMFGCLYDYLGSDGLSQLRDAIEESLLQHETSPHESSRTQPR